jgi:hypothetical protein
MLLGGGTALFEGATPELRLVANEAASKAGAMHLSYAVDNSLVADAGYSRSSWDIRGRGWMLVMWTGASPTLTNSCALPGGAITI